VNTFTPALVLALCAAPVCAAIGSINSPDYQKDLVGIWAMKPIDKPEKGVANVTQFNADGSYRLNVFRCQPQGAYLRQPAMDGVGRWRIEGQDIIMTLEASEKLDALREDMKAYAKELDTLAPKERERILANFPSDVIAALEGKPIITREHITHFDGDQYRSRQEWLGGTYLYFSSKKVPRVEPRCSEY